MDDNSEFIDDDFIFYSLLYSSITVVFAMAVLSKFLTNEFRFGFRSFLSLVMVFIGEPVCHLVLKGSSGVVLFGLGCLLVYSVLPASHLSGEDKTVFITGCDSGFGHALVKKLDTIGMKVYAGCLYKNGPGAIELKNSCSNNLKLIQLDVTNGDQVQAAYAIVSREVGEKGKYYIIFLNIHMCVYVCVRYCNPDHKKTISYITAFLFLIYFSGLWGLVNNAGMWYVAEIEMTPERVFRRALDVNLFGMIRVTKTFLPLIRRGRGRIVNMSSVTAYSDVLRMEMKKWTVKVSVIEPSGFNTAGLNTQTIQERKSEVWKYLDEATQAAYGEEYLNRMYDNFEASIPKYPKDLTPVTQAMCGALLSKQPAPKYVVGTGAGTLINIFPVLPIWLSDQIIRIIGFSVRDKQPLALQEAVSSS
ncbi:hypothetical protein LSH36_511g00021 [Paralvinella palmiformis]|uniref:Estradiol 17-beta-dehydrogenase 2 n=1 Tax=Paralvinella palmiformis TaxID=53620 RepID=A0AAD9MY99_9ANNE|nr:hypothetical protein LSH36_511g00021 [Paralvinella palmiformis]